MSNAESFQKDRSFLEQVKHIIHEGNVRHAVVESKSGHRYVDLPLTLVILGAAFAPWLAAIGVVIAVVAGSAMRVERHGEGEDSASEAATELASDVQQTASGAASDARDAASAAASEVKDAAADAKDTAADAAAKVNEKATELASDVQDAADGKQQS